MTPEQAAVDSRRFTIIACLIVVTSIVMIIASILYVNSCRQTDLRTIKEWIDASKCSCRNHPAQHNDQRVTIDRDVTANDLVREVLISRGHINGNVRGTSGSADSEERSNRSSTGDDNRNPSSVSSRRISADSASN